MWTALKLHLNHVIDKFIHQKWSSNIAYCAFMTKDVQKFIKKWDRYFHKSKRTNDIRSKSHFKQLKATVQRESRRAYWSYIENILCDPEEVQKERPGICKRFWQYIKSQKRNSTGVSSLLYNGQVVSDPQAKAEVLNEQNQSVFTWGVTSNIPNKGTSPYHAMPEIIVSLKSSEKTTHQHQSI